MEQNKTRTYLFYAIGEIALVMIGILLALQVNNWNEQRKMDQVELNLLNEIRQNLQDSREEIESTIQYNQNTMVSYIIILDHIEAGKPYHDSLDAKFGLIKAWSSPYLTFTAYETLKQKGVDLISNTSLRQHITTTFEADFAYLINDWDRVEWRDSESIVMPYFSKHFYQNYEDVIIEATATPNNYDQLSSDPEFKNILTMLIGNRDWGNQSARGISASLRDLISEIDEELQMRGFNREEKDV